MNTKIKNPIIAGFNPDPSIIRVNDTYYIANSTFEWFPGIQIHKSKDLQNWQLCAKPLNNTTLLDMKGNPDSCGVWAPCLTYHDGLFYLVYSNVRTFDGAWKDTPNFLTTTDDIENGIWSDPIFLDSSGFDASLFHDDNGEKWYTTLLVDHRKGKFFGGIGLQKYDPLQQKLVGEMKKIWDGSTIGITEGPHIYKKNGYYYLMTAEGGTEYAHAVSLARSSKIDGPYQTHPANPIISAVNHPSNVLQKTGHGCLVDTPDGKSYIAFLSSRPLTERGRCPLGRETSIAQVEWRNDDWLYLSNGRQDADEYTDAPNCEIHKWPTPISKDDFDEETLDINLNALRIPFDDSWCNLKERPGHLRLYGQQGLASIHTQSMVARRVQAFNIEAETVVEFSPTNFHQMAGLVFYYNTMHMHYLHITHHQETGKKLLQIISADNGVFTEALDNPIDISGNEKIWLKGKMQNESITFFFSKDGEHWSAIGGTFDASILSDDYVQHNGLLDYRAAFTGTFVGICCQDLTGHRLHADFDYFKYEELSETQS